MDGSSQTLEVVRAHSQTQTRRDDLPAIKLSPFDSHELYFVKELVNNLSKDNEVLQQSN